MSPSVPARQRHGRHRFRQRTALLSAAALTIALPATATPALATPALAPPTTATPTRTTPAPAPAVPTLNWQPCDGDFFCATAAVPLDYADPTGATVAIAVIKHPATDPAHRIGSLFFNPGGPGASGVTLTSQWYSQFPPAVRARFDVVGFDPRGVGQSTVLRCFDTNAQEQQLVSTVLAEGYPTGPAQAKSWEDTLATFDQTCAAHAGPLLAHDSTADVARDLDLLRQAVGDPTMNYLGTSYGTYLGATYANLFPDKVRAITLDGNIDPVAWATGTGDSAAVLSTFLREGTDEGAAATLNAFLDLCGQAPVSSCAFSAGSPAATHTKFDTLLDRLAGHPVTLAGTTFTKPFTVTVVRSQLYEALPVPNLTAGWADPATLLENLWTLTGGGPAPASIQLPTNGFTPLAGADAPYSGVESQLGVTCSDSPNPRVPAEYAVQADFAAARSGVVGPIFPWQSEACARWPVMAEDRYTGPWNRPTAAPILVVGNTFDPATPYRDSVAMSHDLADARLLTVHGYGHTAFVNHSSCVDAVEGDYFASGALPAPGTVCQQDQAPFAG
jgi:pimeloyl-ACP methyl ester carboxylesterase